MANIPKNLREQAPAHQDATSEIDAFGHKERTQQANLGYLGKLFGSEKEKPGNISALILIVLVIILFLFIIGWFGCTWSEGCTRQDLFQEILSALVSLITLILGYLFGSHK